MGLRAAKVTVLALALAACGQDAGPWHGTDITGVMPKLEFHMTRAGDGAPVSAQAYRGKIVALYFGYTHCPDICPTTLANLADVLHRLGSKASGVRVLFVTVDPNRDSLPVLKEYTQAFASQIDGLRGSDDALVALTRRYRVSYGVTPASPGHPYAVMHSDSVFFFDGNGNARLVATSTDDAAGLAADVGRLQDTH